MKLSSNIPVANGKIDCEVWSKTFIIEFCAKFVIKCDKTIFKILLESRIFSEFPTKTTIQSFVKAILSASEAIFENDEKIKAKSKNI